MAKTASPPEPDALFPTAQDMTAWEAQTPAEQFARIEQEEEAGFFSGAAPHESLADRLKRVRNL